MRRLKLQADETWETFAAREPFFSVLTHPEYLRQNLTPRAEAEFFQTGEDYVSSLLETIRTHLDPHFTAEDVLEFGCGPGRLAIPLAGRFRRVIAVDISRSMLETAGSFAARLGRTNITFQTVAEFCGGDEPFDLVTCHLVLQRVPRREGHEIVRMLLGRVGHIGVFQLPIRQTAGTLQRTSRAVRAHIPAANWLANVLLRKDSATPLLATTTYDLNEVLEIFREAGFDLPVIRLARHEEYDDATIFVRRRGTRPMRKTAVRASEEVARPDIFIDVRELIERTTMESLNATAEAYFAGLADHEHHITKPFSKADETPTLLINLAVLLQGLDLTPGTSVLDFGAGTGWLSRFLTQLGCRTILLDVSPSALGIARETFHKIPVVGERPEPSFLRFDGRHIDLPDESVDRVVCFDAFHHAPNPAEVLREFARILKPGGIAGFAEPGPAHSQTPQSQYEMRTYGVLENDIDLHAIWRTAQDAGFTDCRVAAYMAMPYHVSLLDYEDLLAGGLTLERWAEECRKYLANVRNFFLFKGGAQNADSRRRTGLRALISVEASGPARANKPLAVRATVTNIGTSLWLQADETPGGVSLGCHLYDDTGRLISFDFVWASLGKTPLAPNEKAEITVTVPSLPPGTYGLEFDCAARGVTWFAQVGSQPATLRITVA